MANELIKALSKSKDTYGKCRRYLYAIVNKDKKKLLSLESSKITVCVPYLIKYVEEEEELKFIEVLNYFNFNRPDLNYHDLVKISLVGCFRKLEKNDKNFEPF